MKKFDKPIYVTKSFLPPFEEYKKEIEKIWETNLMTNNGPIHKELEKGLIDYLNVDNCVLFSNGHLALDIAIKSLKLKGEVITTPFTFASTTHAIVMNGLKPVFCDINLENYTIDVNKIEELINENTSAIVPVHVFGNPCDVEKIKEIADKHNLKVIYDAAHTFGVQVNGKGIGTFGDVSMFSLHATKVYNTVEGGLLTFNNKGYKKQFELYKNFGITGPETVEAVGLNSKMNEFQAAMGIVNLRYVDAEIAKRKVVTERYREGLKEIDGIVLQKDIDNVKQNYSYFPVVIDEQKYGISRDSLFEILGQYNVFPRKYFYPLTSDFQCYKGIFDSNLTPNAQYVANSVLTLPMYGDLPLEHVDGICEIIKGAVNGK